MEGQKGEEKKRGAEAAKILKAAEQQGRRIVEEARREANDEAHKIIREVEEKGHQIIQEALKFAEVHGDKIVAEAMQKASKITEEAGKQTQSEATPRKSELQAQQGDLLIIDEAREKAETEANRIIAEAREKARQIIEEAEGKPGTVVKPASEVKPAGHRIIEEAVRKAEADISKLIAKDEKEARQIIEGAKKNIDTEAEASKIVSQAVKTGLQIVVEAAQEAEKEANKIVSRAEQKAHHIIEEATKKKETEANRIVAQAQTKGLQIIEQATKKAEDEANKIVTQAMQTMLQIVVEAVKKVETETEDSKMVAQAQQTGRKFIEAAKDTVDTKASADTKIIDAYKKTQPFPEKIETVAVTSPAPKSLHVAKTTTEKSAPKAKAKDKKATEVSYKQAEVVIVPPVDFAQLEKLRMSLQKLRNTRLLTTEGYPDGRTSISVLFYTPATLIPDLKDIEVVEEAIEEESLDSHPLSEIVKKALPPRRPSKRKGEQTILVVLKRAS